MTEDVQSRVGAMVEGLDLEALGAWIEGRRWYASKSRHICGIGISQWVPVADEPPQALLVVETRFASGSHELYQVPIAFVADREAREGREPIATRGGRSVIDAVNDPERARDLLALIDSEAQIDTDDGCFGFHREERSTSLPVHAQAAPMGVEQSNSSIVFGAETVLKVFRRLEPGINPELEILRFLTRHGFPHIAPLQGYYEYDGRAFAATLGVAQRFFPEATGGWELALDRIASDPEAFLGELGRLGRVTGELHNAMASHTGDPAFSPEEPSVEALSLLTATIDEDIERVFVRLPDDERVAAIAGRGQDVRERISQRSQIAIGGRAIRTHGDYHLGQTLHLPTGWLIIDFEGEPARPLFERRQKRSPLRDVASMLRSFAYATSASAIMRGTPAPPGFEERARTSFLEQYFSTVDSALLPAGELAIINLLTIFELEKVIYELQYELENRPDWLPIPVAGIERLLEAE